MPALLAVLIGLGMGWASGGRVGALAEFRLRGELLILPLFVVQALLRGRVLGTDESARGAIAIWVAISVVLVICLLMNLSSHGCFVLAMGLIINLAVVLANSGMPVAVSTEAGPDAVEHVSTSTFYAVAGPSTLGSFAGDVMPFELGGATVMISAGDVLLLVGASTMIVSAMLRPDGLGRLGKQADSLEVA